MGYVYIVKHSLEPEQPKGGGCVQAFVIAFIISIVVTIVLRTMTP